MSLFLGFGEDNYEERLERILKTAIPVASVMDPVGELYRLQLCEIQCVTDIKISIHDFLGHKTLFEFIVS